MDFFLSFIVGSFITSMYIVLSAKLNLGLDMIDKKEFIKILFSLIFIAIKITENFN